MKATMLRKNTAPAHDDEDTRICADDATPLLTLPPCDYATPLLPIVADSAVLYSHNMHLISQLPAAASSGSVGSAPMSEDDSGLGSSRSSSSANLLLSSTSTFTTSSSGSSSGPTDFRSLIAPGSATSLEMSSHSSGNVQIHSSSLRASTNKTAIPRVANTAAAIRRQPKRNSAAIAATPRLQLQLRLGSRHKNSRGGVGGSENGGDQGAGIKTPCHPRNELFGGGVTHHRTTAGAGNNGGITGISNSKQKSLLAAEEKQQLIEAEAACDGNKQVESGGEKKKEESIGRNPFQNVTNLAGAGQQQSLDDARKRFFSTHHEDSPKSRYCAIAKRTGPSFRQQLQHKQVAVTSRTPPPPTTPLKSQLLPRPSRKRSSSAQLVLAGAHGLVQQAAAVVKQLVATSASSSSSSASSQQLKDWEELEKEEHGPNEVDEQWKRQRKSILEQAFEHDDSEIPAPARSLHRVQSSSLLEMTISRNELNPQFSDDSPESALDQQHYSLRTVERPQVPHRAFRSISHETLAQLLQDMSQEQFERKFHLIDCRYPYEFNGGHIRNAVNVHDLMQVDEIFYPNGEAAFAEVNRRIPIFYCEFSQKRGPNMALELRRLDRDRNHERYPHVDYKEIYVLDHGYRRFFSHSGCVELCEPRHYVPMLHRSFSDQLKLYQAHKSSRKARSISRANSNCSVPYRRRRIAPAASSLLIAPAAEQQCQSTSKSVRQQLSHLSMHSPSSPSLCTAAMLPADSSEVVDPTSSTANGGSSTTRLMGPFHQRMAQLARHSPGFQLFSRRSLFSVHEESPSQANSSHSSGSSSANVSGGDVMVVDSASPPSSCSGNATKRESSPVERPVAHSTPNGSPSTTTAATLVEMMIAQ